MCLVFKGKILEFQNRMIRLFGIATVQFVSSFSKYEIVNTRVVLIHFLFWLNNRVWLSKSLRGATINYALRKAIEFFLEFGGRFLSFYAFFLPFDANLIEQEMRFNRIRIKRQI